MNKENTRKNPGITYKLAVLLSHEKSSKFTIPLLAIVLTLITTSILLLILGSSPLTAILGFLRAGGFVPKPSYASNNNMFTDFLLFLGIMAPMLFASLGFIISFKAGLFNIGISGQMLLSGFIASLVVGYSDLGPWAAKPLVLLIGMLVGGLMAALVGFLKYKFNIHEVVSAIMFNYIVSYITGFFINSYYTNPITRSSMPISAASRLTIGGVKFGGITLSIPLGIFLAIGAVFIVHFLLERTVMGFEIKATGSNRHSARYAGVNVSKNIVLAMAFSGVLAGLAGVSYYLGYYNTIVPKKLPSIGYDSIAVSILGNSNPFGAIFASALVTTFQNGSTYVSSSTGVAKEIASLITGLLLLFSASGTYINSLAAKYVGEAREQEDVLVGNKQISSEGGHKTNGHGLY